MLRKKYTSQFGKECEILFREKKDIPDMKSSFYRFEIFMRDSIFGCDFTISEQQIKKYNLDKDEIINICFDMVHEIVDEQIEKYCSVRIRKNDIIEYFIKQNDTNRIESIT